MDAFYIDRSGAGVLVSVQQNGTIPGRIPLWNEIALQPIHKGCVQLFQRSPKLDHPEQLEDTQSVRGDLLPSGHPTYGEVVSLLFLH